MSMSGPFIPTSGDDRHDAPAAAEPGPGAPGTPLPEEPDVLPAGPGEGEEDTEREGVSDDPPFRTPVPGDRLTVDEMKDRS